MSTDSQPRAWWTYITIMRPWAFAATFTPVTLGSVLAYKWTNNFDLTVFVLSCVTVISIQAAGNLVNTYYDYVHGVDTKAATDRTLVDKRFLPEEVFQLVGFCYVLGTLGFVALVVVSSASIQQLAPLFCGGLFFSFFYTGGISLKYHGLGDVVILVTFGPLTVLTSYVAQCGQYSIYPVYFTIPLVLITECMLHSNNARDIEEDKASRIVTLAILLGEKGSHILYVFLIFTPYVICATMAMRSSLIYLLPFITFSIPFDLVKCYGEKKLDMPKRTSKLMFCLGITYVLSCLLAY